MANVEAGVSQAAIANVVAGVSQAAMANVVVGESQAAIANIDVSVKLAGRPKANAADVMDMVVASTSSCYQPKEAR